MPRLSSLRMLISSAFFVLPLLAGCPKGDVGAPCNHGRTDPPQDKLVTFPALSCNDLLCIYADTKKAPTTACTPGPNGNQQCNAAFTDGKNRFECVANSAGAGACQLRNAYVLERSMCSRKCSSDDDCKNTSITNKVVVDDTKCETGFKCARIQALGEFCCESLCICNDDLIPDADLNTACDASMQPGCCDQMPKPEGCGPL